MPTKKPLKGQASIRKREHGLRPRGRPKAEDAANLEDRLLDVALTHFIEHGYGGASMARIISDARVSKTTLYSRYSSKDKVLRAIVERQIDRLVATSPLGSDGMRPSLEKGLKAYANRALELSLEPELIEINRLIFSEARRFPELAEAAVYRNATGTRSISRFIRECAIADGIPCKNPTVPAATFIFMLRGWYANEMLSGRPVSKRTREAWVRRTVRAFIAGRHGW